VTVKTKYIYILNKCCSFELYIKGSLKNLSPFPTENQHIRMVLKYSFYCIFDQALVSIREPKLLNSSVHVPHYIFLD